ncbi:tRNA-dihydrouridine(20/20a) synthase [Porphyridium purpureum]|uniref:tRNA-dihydrouridine(20/20a) synthase n=1 Tax=Porphyridium purpureum TaxID=35688 RepID=A0A5J4YMH4_PORPP|nr:tRNA-dihydrouridine(20/20a) synthase [Porphyridium purpureum]|eukprot:POR1308..scf249_10
MLSRREPACACRVCGVSGWSSGCAWVLVAASQLARDKRRPPSRGRGIALGRRARRACLACAPQSPRVVRQRLGCSHPCRRPWSAASATTHGALAGPDERFAVAPMLDVTNHHFRALCRILSKRAVLYTEMIVDNTLIYNQDKPVMMERWLAHDAVQHPIVLQLGGADPDKLAEAARLAAAFRYDAINLNCGCPSPRVAGKGCFGASLMLDAQNVARCCRRMAEATEHTVPVTVKCRIGVDRADETYDFVRDFVRVVHEQGGVRVFAIHARAAWLNGLSPAQNRNIPPLKYEYVSRLADEFPDCTFVLNGGIKSIDDACEVLEKERQRAESQTSTEAGSAASGGRFHGVMLGRAVQNDPWGILSQVDKRLYGDEASGTHLQTREQVVLEYGRYAQRVMDTEPTASLHHVLGPVLDIFHGAPRGRIFRRTVDSAIKDKLNATDALHAALAEIDERVRCASYDEMLVQRQLAGAERSNMSAQPPSSSSKRPRTAPTDVPSATLQIQST